jgi:hypothetical protein
VDSVTTTVSRYEGFLEEEQKKLEARTKRNPSSKLSFRRRAGTCVSPPKGFSARIAIELNAALGGSDS